MCAASNNRAMYLHGLQTHMHASSVCDAGAFVSMRACMQSATAFLNRGSSTRPAGGLAVACLKPCTISASTHSALSLCMTWCVACPRPPARRGRPHGRLPQGCAHPRAAGVAASHRLGLPVGPRAPGAQGHPHHEARPAGVGLPRAHEHHQEGKQGGGHLHQAQQAPAGRGVVGRQRPLR